MKLSELVDKFNIHLFFKRELREFKKEFRWFKVNRDGEISLRWIKWFKDFIQFRRKVLDDSEIEQAFVEWVGVGSYDNGPFSSQSPMRKKMNVPQLCFFDHYEKAKKLTLKVREENEHKD